MGLEEVGEAHGCWLHAAWKAQLWGTGRTPIWHVPWLCGLAHHSRPCLSSSGRGTGGWLGGLVVRTEFLADGAVLAGTRVLGLHPSWHSAWAEGMHLTTWPDGLRRLSRASGREALEEPEPSLGSGYGVPT